MNRKSIAMGLMIASLSFGAFAQDAATSESTSTLKQSDVKPPEAGLKDIDQEITNAKLRAESGSKKKWSFRSMFYYSGSSIITPFAADRPSFTGNATDSGNTSLDGEIGIKYRAADRHSLSLKTGISYLRPGAGDMPDGSNKFEIANPSLTWDYVQRVRDFQLITSAGAEVYTSQELVDRGMLANLNVAQTAMYSAGNGWDLGAVADFNRYVLDNREGVENFSYQVGLYPMVEYAFNDRYSFRTVFRYWTFQSNRQTPYTFDRLLGSQSIGLGIAVTRDFYMYPNLQFAPTNLKPEVTTWGIQTAINL